MASCLLTSAWQRLPTRPGDYIWQLSATDSLHRDCQSYWSPAGWRGVGGQKRGKWGFNLLSKWVCMSREETAFIWIHCVAREASSDTQSPLPFLPKHTSVFDVSQVFVCFSSVLIFQCRLYCGGKYHKYNLFSVIQMISNNNLSIYKFTFRSCILEQKDSGWRCLPVTHLNLVYGHYCSDLTVLIENLKRSRQVNFI